MSISLFTLPFYFRNFSEFLRLTNFPFVPDFSLSTYDSLAPSRLDSITPADELQRRRDCFSFIFEFSSFLRLPIRCPMSALALTNKFFARRSLAHYSMREIASTALFLCSKVDECPRKLADFAGFYHSRHPELELLSENDVRERFMALESEILFTIDFSFNQQTPIEYLMLLARIFQSSNRVESESLAVGAMKFAAIAQSSTASLHFSPQAIASAAIFLSSSTLRIDFGSRISSNFMEFHPPWWRAFSGLGPAEFSSLLKLIINSVEESAANSIFPGFGESLRSLKSSDSWLSSIRFEEEKSRKIPTVVRRSEIATNSNKRKNFRKRSNSRSPERGRNWRNRQNQRSKSRSRSRSWSPTRSRSRSRSPNRNGGRDRERRRSRSLDRSWGRGGRDRERRKY